MTASDLPPPVSLVVFGAAWCEDTRRTRRLLRRLGVPHRYRDIDEDLEALEQASALNKGVRRTPVVSLGDEVLVEPSNETLTLVLLRHGLLTDEAVSDRLRVQNVGDLERCLRVSAGLLVLACRQQAPGALRAPIALTGVGLLITGIAGWCPVFHAKGVTSMNGPGDRPDEAEDRTWLRPVQHESLERPE